MTVRTRFAPSPTGNLHIGSVRTALYAWLFAKHHQGQFILRVEDTDAVRSTEESVTAILEGMAWLGLSYDEGPFYQTERLDRYQVVIQQLLDAGKAYRCVCTKARLDTLRADQMAAKQKPKYDGCCRDKSIQAGEAPFVIRFKTPLEGEVSFTDHVYGDITVSNQELDDLIIQKSDGMPTYNLAVVVDDMDMEITDVIRGDDHINNTPRQINIYHALEAKQPRFAHLPMILGEDGKRLSKRHGAVNVMSFKESGYLPHAMLNYLVRLGWSHGDQEIFSMEEMISHFDLTHISKGGSTFSFDKLNWVNQHYLKTDDSAELVKQLLPLYQSKSIDLNNGPALTEIVPAFVERSKTLLELVEKTAFLFQDDIEYDEKSVSKHLKAKIKVPFEQVIEGFEQLPNWQPTEIHEVIEQVCQKLELKMGKVAQPIRVAVTGAGMSPSIDITLAWLGRDRVLARLRQALTFI